MPPPQCPECGRFLATAFVEQITTEPAPCPGCGTELSLAPEEPSDEAVAPETSPPVPPPAATLPPDGDAGAVDVLDEGPSDEAPDADDAEDADDGTDDDLDVELGDTSGPATEAPDGDEVAADGPPLTPAAAAVAADVEPEPTTSVRPPDRAPDRDPLEGWDQSGSLPAPADELDPVELAVGAGVGLLLGMLLGGRRHRGLGALLGALLGAVASRLRG